MSHFSRRTFVKASAFAPIASVTKKTPAGQSASTSSDREYWLRVVTRLADPILSALSQHKLKVTMPVEAPHGNAADRRQFTHLEALGRLLAGISAWLELDGRFTAEEARLHARYTDLARESIAAAVDPASPDYMNFTKDSQPLVDAAFLALALLRAPTELWAKLDNGAKSKLIEALRSTRSIRPPFNNWLLFSATIEAFLCSIGEPWDPMRVDYAIRQHEEWYKGDSTYGDGPELHWDYYNSFVIHPMLLVVAETVAKRSNVWDSLHPAIVNRARRYAAIQERLIAPDATFPAFGRSLAYRFGAFHLLAAMALRKQLPDAVAPGQVRTALTAVIRQMLECPGTFDQDGWLTVGFCGHQPSIAEPYISTGSLYLCSTALLPLGLPAADPFWASAPQPWTSRKVWSGQDVPADHAI